MTDNKGFVPIQRGVITTGAVVVAGIIDVLFWDWPASVYLAEVWAPILHMGAIAVGTFLLVPMQKSQREIAVAEFAHLGLRPDLIETAIVANRQKAKDIVTLAEVMLSPTNKGLVSEISREALSIIADFAADTSDVSRSRTLLGQCLDQTRKVIVGYLLIEARKGVLTSDEFVDIAVNTEMGLKQIHSALVELHRRNLDNNQTALEIDLEISDQLLRNI